MTDPHKEALAPCPFCGALPEVRTAMGEYWVHCGGCEATSALASKRNLGVVTWNRRAPDPLLEEAVGLLRETRPFVADDSEATVDVADKIDAFLERMEADRKE